MQGQKGGCAYEPNSVNVTQHLPEVIYEVIHDLLQTVVVVLNLWFL